MVALGRHHDDFDGHRTLIGVMHGGGGTPLSADRAVGMRVIPRKALDMYGSPPITILYLLGNEEGDLEDKFEAWIGDTRG